MTFVDIPLDVLLEITRDLDLPDSLHLVATCKKCNALLSSPSFWIIALNRMKQIHRRPLPCSPRLAISSMPLESLREKAIHTYKLKKNWALESPSPTSVHSLTIEDGLLHFLPIPGSRLLVIISRSRFACWDTISGECLDGLEHVSEPKWAGGLSPLVLPGMFSVGIAYTSPDENGLELAVIRCDHRNPLAVKLSKVFATIWTTPDEGLLVPDISLNETMIAATVVHKAHYTASLLFCEYPGGIIHSLPLGSTADGHECTSLPRGLIAPDGFYITRQYYDGAAEIIHLRTSAMHPSSIDDFQVEKISQSVPSSAIGPVADKSLGFCNTRVPEYGVLNVTRRMTYVAGEPDGSLEVLNALHFWPAEHDGSQLSVTPLCSYEHPCEFAIAVGSSGTCAITMDEEKSLGLVQYIPHPTPHLEFRRLGIPDLEVPTDSYRIAVDDGLGILYIVDTRTEGDTYPVGPVRLTVVSYA
ncbi:hypothetical protein FB451DRAFT_1249005 [Mycena latifolia]|nr:hypothetical protein FB451DRAFT_1249005 [Mycena latifolia]